MKKVTIVKNGEKFFESNNYFNYYEEVIINYADLEGADLKGADLKGADFDDDEIVRFGKILKEDMIGYKKCKGNIVKLKIPKGAIVFSINNYKCRTNIADVISINGSRKKGLKICSDYNSDFVYEVGKRAEIENFNLMYNVECASGIHFFMNEEDARNYNQ